MARIRRGNGLAAEVYQSNDDDMMMLRKRDESSMPTDTVLIAWCRQSWTVRRMMMDDCMNGGGAVKAAHMTSSWSIDPGT
jgi:hypothetical protein